jgi:hypothetical protein
MVTMHGFTGADRYSMVKYAPAMPKRPLERLFIVALIPAHHAHKAVKRPVAAQLQRAGSIRFELLPTVQACVSRLKAAHKASR